MSKKLRADPFWKNVFKLSNDMAHIADEITENYPDEKYKIAFNLKKSASEMLHHLSQGLAIDSEPSGNPYEYREAKKNAFSLQANYLLASSQGILKAEPSTVVALDEIISELDRRIHSWKKSVASTQTDDN